MLLEKQQAIKEIFSSCSTPEQRYQKIIELGRKLPPYDPALKTSERLVPGCQSQMYLHASCINGRMVFLADSDALISKGLAALLLAVYNGETPEAILRSPPTFLEDLQIPASLSPSRSNGLFSLHLRIPQESVKFLTVPEPHL